MSKYILNKNTITEALEIKTIVSAYFPEWDGRKPLLCPLHAEKTPSFHVNEQKNIATCFGGCGSFDAIELVRELDNMSFVEALEKCAKLHNIEVKYDTKKTRQELDELRQQEEHRLQLLQANRLASAYYYKVGHSSLKEQPAMIDLDGRSLSMTTVEKYGICRTPNDARTLSQSGINTADLEEVGLIKASDRGAGYFDLFRNRTLFPIHALNGQVVGFAGRKRSSDTNPKNPKYLNSKESTVYKKGQHLYGLFQQRGAIRKADEALLVEGYWDVLSLYDQGIKQAVALCGTALSKDQTQLLKRFCSRVVFIADNDTDKVNNAGLHAVRRALPQLLKAQLFAELVLLPDGEDPDSYVRSFGGKETKAYIKENRQDAFLWYVRDILKNSAGDAMAKAEIATNLVALLRYVDNEHLTDFYVNEVPKILKLKKDTFRLQLYKAREALIEKRSKDGSLENGLNNDQQESLNRYSLYEENNRLMAKGSGGGHFQVANFVVKPLFHIEGEDPRRLFEVTNTRGITKLIDTGTNALVSLGGFMTLVESFGNYVFTGENIHYTRLKRKIYDLMGTAQEVKTLGYHPKGGFYTFGNGVFDPKVGFIPASEQGIVLHDKHRYFLPACSNLYKDKEESYHEEKNFLYQPSKTTFAEWAKLFVQVHGSAHGPIAVMWVLGALYRSTIMKTVKFPLLNLFGQPQTGKSFLGENLLGLFQQAPVGLHLKNCTKASFFNKLVTVRDGVLLFEEYKNSIIQDKWEGLKDVFDGLGREYGQKSSRKNKRTAVLSGGIVSGQELPTVDYALFTRCITLEFQEVDYNQLSNEEKTRATQLKGFRGQLSGMVAELTKLRSHIEEVFPAKFQNCIRALAGIAETERKQEQLRDPISTRMVENNATLIALHLILKDYLEFPFDNEMLFEQCVKTMLKQHLLISQESESAQFWEFVEYLATAGKIHEDQDFKLRYGQATDYDLDTQILQLSLSRVYQLFAEAYQKRNNRSAMSKTSLQHYLKGSTAFLGTDSSVRLGQRVTSCFSFDYKKLGISLQGGDG